VADTADVTVGVKKVLNGILLLEKKKVAYLAGLI
jgi:hypothetical protein